MLQLRAFTDQDAENILTSEWHTSYENAMSRAIELQGDVLVQGIIIFEGDTMHHSAWRLPSNPSRWDVKKWGH